MADAKETTEIIEIVVDGKYAKSPTKRIVCGNSDYAIKFLFSSEWAAHDLKTARFIYNGHEEEEPFKGDTVKVPKVINANLLEVGVYAGDLSTTTPALVGCDKSILCKSGLPPDPAPDVYAKLIAMLESGAIKGEKGDKGDPYVLTDTDKADITNTVLQSFVNVSEVGQ